ncbi:MAG TPA: DUF2079 domain-containing protein [Pseudonocardiaceae bacterium]
MSTRAVLPVRKNQEPLTGWPALWRRAGMALPVVFFALYTASSLLRDHHLGTAGYDLGIFDQAVQSYAHLDAPMTPLKGPGFNLLGDHFSPILALLAPLYRIWPDRRLLLVAQALLLAVSVVPVVGVTARKLGHWAGFAVGVAYGLSWGIQGMVGYDFHEVAFAIPLLAFAMAALAENRYRAVAVWALPLLLVKEDMGLTVAAIGLVLVLRRQWRLGAGLTVAGIGTFLLTTLVIIPHLDHLFHTYRYWSVVGSAKSNTAPAPGIGQLLRLLVDLPRDAVTPTGKLTMLLWLFGIVAFVVFRSPLLLVAVPTLLWRLVSTNPAYWSIGQVHYNAVLMPIVFVAFADAVASLRSGRWRLLRGCGRIAVPVVLAVALLALPRFSLWDLTRAATYRADPHAAAARALAGRIPSGAEVSASNYLVPVVVDRCVTVLFPNVHRVPVDYVLVDTTNLYGVPLPHDQQEAYLIALPGQGYHLIGQADGIELFQRDR